MVNLMPMMISPGQLWISAWELIAAMKKLSYPAFMVIHHSDR
jgi:hypothetical protein